MSTPATPSPEDPGLTWFNGLDDATAERESLACCASPSWARDVTLGRPYADRGALRHRIAEAASAMPDDDLEQALSTHPRIGERVTGTGEQAAWSRGEQAGVTGASDRLLADLADGNRRYERRFGRVFLICAAGLTATQMLTALNARLEHDAVTEREVVKRELGAIAERRFEALLDRRDAR